MSKENTVKWYSRPISKNGPEDDFVRDRILMQVYQAIEVAYADDKSIITRCFEGRCIVKEEMQQGCPIVTFNWVSDKDDEHVTFWMNKSSVQDLFMIFRRIPEGDFEDIFSGKYLD